MIKLVSKQCIDFIKSFEGFSATPYYDAAGIRTLGYGMTGSEIAGISSVTETQATSMLEDLLNNSYAMPINISLINKGVSLTQNQFDALVSFAYNLGLGTLFTSTLYKNVCAGVRDIATITANFTAYCYSAGKQLAGLLTRRQQEASMFFGTGNMVENDAADILITNVKSSTLIQQIKALQYWLNVDYRANLVHEDGNVWQETLDNLEAVGKIIIKGHKSHVVQWVQQKLIHWGFLGNGQDTMIYDTATFQAVTNLQKAWGRETSGKILVSNRTWEIFLNN